MGRFALQACEDCGAVTYPPRDACPKCLGELIWRDVSPLGTVIAETTLHSSVSLYYRARMPWRIATLVLDVGLSLIAHLHADCAIGQRARVLARLDRSGHAVLIGVPLDGAPNLQNDLKLRDLTCAPNYRRVLLTDGRHPATLALARGLIEAGAVKIFIGSPSAITSLPARDVLTKLAEVEFVPLDVTDFELCRITGGQHRCESRHFDQYERP